MSGKIANTGDAIKRRVGRPPASDGAQTRRAIIEAASRQMATVGYDGMSLEQVASEASITRSAIYRYFDSKRDLAQVVLLESAPMVDAYFAEEVVGAESLAERLRALMRACLRATLENPEAVVGFFQLGRLAADDPETARIFNGRSATVRRLLVELIDDGAARGEIAPGSNHAEIVDALSGLILAMAAGVTEASTNARVRSQILLAADLLLRQPEWLVSPIAPARSPKARKRSPPHAS